MQLHRIRAASAGLFVIASAIGALSYGCNDDSGTTVKTETGKNGTPTDGGKKTPTPEASTDDDAGGDGGANDSSAPDTSTAVTASANVQPITPATVNGSAKFVEATGELEVTLTVQGGVPGPHGVHIHEGNNCGDAGAGAGGHFNPGDAGHGLPDAAAHHAGDLGNLIVDDAGKGTLSVHAAGLSLGDGGSSIVGRTIVVHEHPDDGTAGDAGPGNSGARVGCGVITRD